MLEVKDTYTSLSQTFSLVKNYVYEGSGDLNDFGILKSIGPMHSIYLIQDRENKDLAYRLYKGYQNKGFDQKRDASMIQRLRINSYNLQNIDLPHGVVTMNNRIIGQAIPYYEGASDLASLKGTEANILSYLLKACSLIKDLYDHHIFYIDIHEHNFMIKNQEVKLIDFDSDFIGFAKNVGLNSMVADNTVGLNYMYEKHIINNFKRMIHSLLGYGFELVKLDFACTLGDLYEQLLRLEGDQEKVKKL